MGIVTVVTSGKGGVGKSTTSVGLGRSLAKKGKRVILIDCDAGLRTLDKLLGVEESLVYDISDIVGGRCRPIEAIYPCENQDGLFVIPAAQSGENTPSVQAMTKLVGIVKKYFDHVILDSPAGLGEGFSSAACSADRAIIVCTADPVCVRSSAKTALMLRDLNINKQRLIINRFNNELFGKINVIEDLDKVIDETGVRLLGVVPEDYNLVASFLKGEKAGDTSSGMLALNRISSRLDGENIPVLFE